MLRENEVNVGDARDLRLVSDLTRTRIVQYAGASGDFNPLHTDEIFARDVAGFPSVFAHGMLTMGMTGRIITDWVGVESLTMYAVRFVGQVWPGDSLTAHATVSNIGVIDDVLSATFEINTLNQHGETVLTGTARARLTPTEGH
jgi:acyl dehydratase